jgi:CHAT domain-containing protein
MYLPAPAEGKPGGAANPSSVELANVDAIRRAPRLPDTADTVNQLASALKAGAGSVWLQARATETQVKGMDLSRYRTLVFAAHGVVAGQTDGPGEPGLVLTPPKAGSAEDDGYLSAGEIAKLKLHADWVLLPACTTAAADGTPGVEGLSSLAKAFFYAGASSLLVSHWAAPEATVPLTTVMLREYESSSASGKAQALRKAILSLMNTPGHPEYAHPLYWAPWVLVGDGG